MDNEKYTDSLIYSIQEYLEKLQYLGLNKRTTVRALSTYKIFHWLYSWADWYEISESNKLKLEKLMTCLILRNSTITLPINIPQTFYTNVNSPQNLWTWRIFPTLDSITHDTLGVLPNKVLTIQAINTNIGAGTEVSITASPEDVNHVTSGDTSFILTYLHGEEVEITAPSLLLSGNLFDYWSIGGVSQTTNTTITLTMDANYTLVANYREPIPPVGAIIVEKQVIDSNNDPLVDSTYFTILLENTGGNVQLGALVNQDSTKIFSGLELNTYIITEEEHAGYTIESVNPQTVILTEGTNQNQTVTFINKKIEPIGVGTVTVTKVISGGYEGVPFTIYLHDTAGILPDQYRTIDQSNPVTFTNVPFGEYNVFEILPENSIYFIGSITPVDPLEPTQALFTLNSGNPTQAVVVTNIINV